MATQYISAEEAKGILGAAAVALVAPDPDSVDGIDAGKLSHAVDAANSRIDAEVQIRYDVPVDIAHVPDWLKRDASYLVHEYLCGDDAANTDLIRQRAQTARENLKRIARGELKLKLETGDETASNAERTASGRVHLVGARPRRFTRNGTSGAL